MSPESAEPGSGAGAISARAGGRVMPDLTAAAREWLEETFPGWDDRITEGDELSLVAVLSRVRAEALEEGRRERDDEIVRIEVALRLHDEVNIYYAVDGYVALLADEDGNPQKQGEGSGIVEALQALAQAIEEARRD